MSTDLHEKAKGTLRQVGRCRDRFAILLREVSEKLGKAEYVLCDGEAALATNQEAMLRISCPVLRKKC